MTVVLCVALGVTACKLDSSTVDGGSDGGDAGTVISEPDAGPPPPPCVTGGNTYLDIINACTNAEQVPVDRSITGGYQLPDGGLPALGSKLPANCALDPAACETGGDGGPPPLGDPTYCQNVLAAGTPGLSAFFMNGNLGASGAPATFQFQTTNASIGQIDESQTPANSMLISFISGSFPYTESNNAPVQITFTIGSDPLGQMSTDMGLEVPEMFSFGPGGLGQGLFDVGVVGWGCPIPSGGGTGLQGSFVVYNNTYMPATLLISFGAQCVSTTDTINGCLLISQAQ